MSYAALATDRFEEVADFYGRTLGFPVIDQWDRPAARGMRFDLGGMRLEILDNRRGRRPLKLSSPHDRFQVVVEVEDIEEAYDRICVDAPAPTTVSWGARIFQLRDPDGVPVTYLEWLRPRAGRFSQLRGMVSSGIGRGQYFTQLDWARKQFVDRLGIDPHPGTLNVVLHEPADVAVWMGLRSTPGIRIDNPGDGPNDCDARCYPVSIDGFANAAIVLPEAASYPEAQIEIIAAIGLRQTLGKGDGDEVVLEILNASPADGTIERREAQ